MVTTSKWLTPHSCHTPLMCVTSKLSPCPCDGHLICVITGTCHISVTSCLWLSPICLNTHVSVTWHLSHQECDCHLTFVMCFMECHIISVITHDSVISHQAQAPCVSSHIVTTSMWVFTHTASVGHITAVTVPLWLSPPLCHHAQLSHHICHIAPVTSFLSQHMWQIPLTSVTPRVWSSPHIWHMPYRESHICHITHVHVKVYITNLFFHNSHYHNHGVIVNPQLAQTTYDCHITPVTRSLWLSSHVS